MISVDLFQTVFPNAHDADQWVEVIDYGFQQYEINTASRIAAFLSQCGHESGGWTRFEENLNYSAQRLVQVFPKYFPSIDVAQRYHRQPQLIANRVYSNRMGNGAEDSGDGWKYRGRGPIQLTGRNNYISFAKDSFDNWQEVVDNPDLVIDDKMTSLKSALWFWKLNNLNYEADQQDLKRLTKKINGGYNGIEEREHLYHTILGQIE